MSKNLLAIGLLVLASAAMGYLLGSSTHPVSAGIASEEIGPFNEVAFASTVINGWENENLEMIGSYMSDLYNEHGHSKQDALGKVQSMLDEYDDIQLRYRVLDFKQYPGTKLGSVRAVLELLGRRSGDRDLVPIVQTMGYASVIFENGDWKIYCTQEATNITPEFTGGFDFESASTGWWTEWGTQESPEEIQKRRNELR